MATFSASATAPGCDYARTATMDDAAFAEVLDTVRWLYPNETMTDAEACNKMLGRMLLEWTQLTATRKAEALKDAPLPTAPDWVVVA